MSTWATCGPSWRRAPADPHRARGRLRPAGDRDVDPYPITLVGVGIVTLVICCLSASLFALISRGLDTDRDTAARRPGPRSLAAWPPPPRDDFEPSTPLARIDPRSSVDIFVMVLRDDGTVAADTGEVDGAPLSGTRSDVLDAAAAGRHGLRVGPGRGRRSPTRRYGCRCAPGRGRTSGCPGSPSPAQTSRRMNQDRAGLVVLFTVSGFITFVAAAIAVWVATGRALRPLRQMAAMADEVGQSQDLGRRLPAVATKDAVGRLTHELQRDDGPAAGGLRPGGHRAAPPSSGSPPTRRTSCAPR